MQHERSLLSTIIKQFVALKSDVARFRILNRKMLHVLLIIFLFHGARAQSGPGPPHYRCFTITRRHTILGNTPLEEWSARRKDLYLKKHNTKIRHPCPPQDTKPQSQQGSGSRPTPQTAWPLGSAHLINTN